MKKNHVIAAMLCVATVLSGCSTMGTKSNNLLGNSTTTSTLTSAGTSVLGTLLTTLLGNTTSQNSIVGTWTYSKPKVAFESENVLAQIGSSVASSKIENTLEQQLKRVGFSAGKTSMTFKSDGTCIMNFGTKSYSGTYTYNTQTGRMTINGALGVSSISPYVSVMGNELYMLFDADKILGLCTKLGSISSQTNTLSNLLSSYNGLKLGWTMAK